MGESKSKLPAGVRPRGDHIQINFQWNGERHFVKWPYPPTPTNIAAAARVRAQVASKSKYGQLTLDDLCTLFPWQYQQEAISGSFGVLAQSWLDTVQVSHNTRNEYRKSLQKYWMPAFGFREIGTIRYSELRDLVARIEWSSVKTRNNSLIPLRGVFVMAYHDELIDRDPSERLKNGKHQKPPPDPFSREEAELIIADLYRHHGDDVVYPAYVEFAFFTGMRSSEMLALTWKDIDFREGIARVAKAQSKGVLNEQTKTSKIRDVILNERAIHALKQMKPHTRLLDAEVFRSPRTGEAWATEKPPRDAFASALRRLQMRHRPCYNTRHTYATMMLMAGLNFAFCASQLGHSVVMFTTTYAKWLNGDQDREEIKKLKLGVA